MREQGRPMKLLVYSSCGFVLVPKVLWAFDRSAQSTLVSLSEPIAGKAGSSVRSDCPDGHGRLFPVCQTQTLGVVPFCVLLLALNTAAA